MCFGYKLPWSLSGSLLEKAPRCGCFREYLLRNCDAGGQGLVVGMLWEKGQKQLLPRLKNLSTSRSFYVRIPFGGGKMFPS